MELLELPGHSRTGVPFWPAALDAGDAEDFNAEVRNVVRALRRLDVGNGRLRGRLANELGISVTGLNALAYVGTADGLTPKQLAGELGVATGTVTLTIDHLERSGFVIRRPNPLDRRSLILRLTPAGDQALDWVYDYFNKAVATSLSYQDAPAGPALAEFLDHAASAMTELSARTHASSVPQPAQGDCSAILAGERGSHLAENGWQPMSAAVR